MPLELQSLEKAIISLEGVLERALDKELMSRLDTITQFAIKAGAIQNFEFSYELCWKFMKRWLSLNIGATYVDGISRKELFRIAAENRLINNTEKWFSYHNARNLTSHIYDEEVAEEVFAVSIDFLEDAQKFLQEIKNKND